MKLQTNALDRALAVVAPRLALKRAQARTMFAVAGGYEGASRKSAALFRFRPTEGASADFDSLPDLATLRARSYALVRNDPIARSAIQTKVTNVVGVGHKLRPDIDAEKLGLGDEAKRRWEARALEVWQEWAEGQECDIRRTLNFAELEDLVYRSKLMSGDVCAIRRFRPRVGRLLATCVQVVEAGRLSNPNHAADSAQFAAGVEMDRDGAPVAYHFASRHQFEAGRAAGTEWRRVPAFDRFGRRIVLHNHGIAWRPDMTRFEPMLAPVIEPLKQRSRYTQAELMAAVVASCFVLGFRSPDGAMSEGLEVPAEGANDGGGPSSQRLASVEPGKIFDVGDDEYLEAFKPGRPSAEFAPFIDAVSQDIACGTDMPHELLTKHFQASYSASRAALEIARQGFKVERARHVSQFCWPIYEDVMSEAVARGLLEAPGFFADPLQRRAWLGAAWMGMEDLVLDPVRQANADRAYLDMGVLTRTQLTAERFGNDYERVRRRVREELGGLPAAEGAGVAGSDEPLEGSDRED